MWQEPSSQVLDCFILCSSSFTSTWWVVKRDRLYILWLSKTWSLQRGQDMLISEGRQLRRNADTYGIYNINQSIWQQYIFLSLWTEFPYWLVFRTNISQQGYLETMSTARTRSRAPGFRASKRGQSKRKKGRCWEKSLIDAKPHAETFNQLSVWWWKRSSLGRETWRGKELKTSRNDHKWISEETLCGLWSRAKNVREVGGF